LLEKGDYLNTDDDSQLNKKIALLKEAVPCFNEVKYTWIKAGIWKSLGDLYGLRRLAPGNIALALELINGRWIRISALGTGMYRIFILKWRVFTMNWEITSKDCGIL